MVEWKEYTVTDVISTVIDYRGKTPKKLGGDWSDSGYRALSAKNIKTGKIVQVDSIRYVSEEMYKCWMKEEVQKEDILITSEAPFGQIYYWDSDEKIVLSQRLFAVRVNQLFYPKYIYFYMTSSFFQAELDGRATGTTVVGLRQPELLKCKIYAPNYKEQKRIADTLWCLEQKINNNEAINNNLEQQAQAIYQQMFIDNARSDWAEGTLSDIADITMGQSPSGSSYNEDGTGIIFFQGRAEFGFRFPSVRLYTTEPKRMARSNDTLMSVRAPVGDLNVAHTDCCIGRGLAAIHSKSNHQSFVLYTMFSLKKQLDVFNGEGTVFGSINRNSLNDMPILIPSDDILDEFERIVAPMDLTIRNNYDENCRLQDIRDTLLPRLMSGELDVSDIDI